MCAKFETANLVGSCVEECEAPAKQPNVTEHDLVRQLQAGNEMAYRKFVVGYQSKVYAVAYGILGNREEADEIAQQVFVKVYFSIKSFDARSSLYIWLHRIAVNECYGFLRKKRLKLPCESDSANNDISICVQMSPDLCPNPDRVVQQRDLLNKLLERIPGGSSPAAIERARRLLSGKALEGNRTE